MSCVSVVGELFCIHKNINSNQTSQASLQLERHRGQLLDISVASVYNTITVKKNLYIPFFFSAEMK